MTQSVPFDFVLAYGGRDYTDRLKVAQALSVIRTSNLVLVQGGAKGADRLAKEWAFNFGVPCLTMEAQWEYYGMPAGPIRNRWMANAFKFGMAVEFPGGSGTKDMRKILLNLHVPIWYATEQASPPTMKAYSV